MVETIEGQNAAAAYGKLKPIAHGPFIRTLGTDRKPPLLTYFQLTLASDAPVSALSHGCDEWNAREALEEDNEEENDDVVTDEPELNNKQQISLPLQTHSRPGHRFDLEWPLPSLCNHILRFLMSFEAADPKNFPCKFYHGSSNSSNYVLDLKNKRIWMLDFGHAYFAWKENNSEVYLSPIANHLPNKWDNDILTFYKVLRKLLKMKIRRFRPNGALLGYSQTSSPQGKIPNIMKR